MALPQGKGPDIKNSVYDELVLKAPDGLVIETGRNGNDLYVWPRNAPDFIDGGKHTPLWGRQQSHFHLSFAGRGKNLWYLEKVQITIRVGSTCYTDNEGQDTTGFHKYMAKEDFNNVKTITSKVNDCITWWITYGETMNSNVVRIFKAMMKDQKAILGYGNLWVSKDFQGEVYNMIRRLTDNAPEW